MSQYAPYVVVLFAGFALRVWPQLTGAFDGSDNWFHEWLCAELTRNRWRMPRSTAFLLPGRVAYPPLLHYLLLTVPRSRRMRLAYYVNPLADLAILALLLVTGGVFGLPRPTLLLVAALYWMCPLNLQFNCTSMYAVSARTMSRLFAWVAVGAFFAWLRGGDWWLWVVGAVAMAGIHLSSKFGVQVLLFSLLVVPWWYPAWAAYLACGYAAAILLSGGFALQVTREHVAHQIMYWRKARHYGTAGAINNPADFRWALNPPHFFTQPARYLSVLLYRLSPTRSLLLMPLVWGGLAVVLASGRSLTKTDGWGFLLVWTAACALAFVLTSFKALISLGEPHRYWEYALLPMLLILARMGAYGALSGWWVLAVGLAMYAFTNFSYLQAMLRHRPTAPRRNAEGVRAFLAARAPGRAMCVPLKLAYAFAADHRHRWLWQVGRFPLDFYDRAFVPRGAPWPRNLRALRDHYGLDTLVIEAGAVSRYQAQLDDISATPVYTDEAYSVYHIAATQAAPAITGAPIGATANGERTW